MVTSNQGAEPTAGQVGRVSYAPARWLRLVAVPGMLLSGVLVAVQSRVNGQLGEEFGSGLLASVLTAMFTFCVGVLITGLVIAVLPQQRRNLGHFGRSLGARVMPWRLIWGGALGVLFVISQAVAVAPIGLAVFTMAIVFGQTAGGAAADWVGLGPGGHQPLSVPRGIAAMTALLAVVLASSGAGNSASGASTMIAIVLVAFAVVAGGGTAVQQALNGRVSAVAGPYVAAWLNTAVGSVVLILALGVALLLPHDFGAWPTQWWPYTGGPLGITFIGLSALLVRVHGVLVLMLCTIAGQMATAWAIAVAESSHIPWTTHVATTLILLGVGIAVVARRR